MPSCIIHCFSGTGNTPHAMTSVFGLLIEVGYAVLLHPIEGEDLHPKGGVHLNLAAFPVYTCAPKRSS